MKFANDAVMQALLEDAKLIPKPIVLHNLDCC
jgi:arsenate reductase-like glutaredoxin family protein